jgi:hypothetical protein
VNKKPMSPKKRRQKVIDKLLEDANHSADIFKKADVKAFINETGYEIFFTRNGQLYRMRGVEMKFPKE